MTGVQTCALPILIFDDMTIEAVEHYVSLFRMLPLEVVNPQTLLPYLPIGKQQTSFGTKAKQLLARETFQELFVNDVSCLFESLAVEYCFELNQPGKTLVLLIEALQNRQIQISQGSVSSDATQASAKSGLNLTWIALEAAEQAMNASNRALPEDRKERLRFLVGK